MSAMAARQAEIIVYSQNPYLLAIANISVTYANAREFAMSLTQVAKNLIKMPLLGLLSQSELRRRIIFELTHRYYSDLNVLVPIGHQFVCPITHWEHIHSFSEIFLAEGEYTSVFKKIELPQRWLDIGCHAGYFSLFVAWLRAKHNLSPNCRCLLVDADPRVESAVEKLLSLNHLDQKMIFRPGVIAKGAGERKFAIRPVMCSSVASEGESGAGLLSVPVLTESDIEKLLPPPYDLIKVDIEGAEYEFLESYDQLIRQSKYLLLEWHSWHSGGGSGSQIQSLTEVKGFKLIDEPSPPHTENVNGTTVQCGVFLFEKTTPLSK